MKLKTKVKAGMQDFETVEVETDLLICGGGMA